LIDKVDFILSKRKVKKNKDLLKAFRKSLETLYLEIKAPKRDPSKRFEYSFDVEKIKPN